MSDILQHLSTDNLVKAIEENMQFMISLYRTWPRAEIHDADEIKWSMTDIPFPLFNNIMGAHLEPESVDATIQSLVAQGRSRNVPLLWTIGPGSQPADLGAHLTTYGFFEAANLPGMALDLTRLSENQPTPADFSIQAVEDQETFKLWVNVCCQGFEIPDFAAGYLSELKDFLVSDEIRVYLGWLNDRPVATSLLVMAAGVAGIYNVATLPEARRQGIGALMTAIPLRDAREMGYKAAILHATEMGAGVYRALGFQDYCQISQYVWLPETGPEAG